MRNKDGRWPSHVYGEGVEPDYRFSLANERTFLAWIRTSLALLAAGVALDVIDLSIPTVVQHAIAMLLVALGLVSALAAWVRWARAERAIRRGEPLPHFGLGALFVIVVVVASVGLMTAGLDTTR